MSSIKDTNYLNIVKEFNDKGYKILDYINKSTKITYICVCGNERDQLYKDIINRNCIFCKEIETKEKKIKEEQDIIDDNGEIWRKIIGCGWISSFGRAKSINNKILTLCPTKFRYTFNGKAEYASRLVAINFKLENYEKLNTQNYIVHHKDGNKSNNHIDNLEVIPKYGAEAYSNAGKKSRQSEDFKQKLNIPVDEYKDMERKILSFMPNHVIFENGQIYNGERFLTGSKSDNYLTLFISPTQKYKIHRLVCMAFYPIEGLSSYEDYNKHQVNHKDGNKLNNSKNNLEWASQSQNIQHAYNNKLNRKTRQVIQYNKETKEKINEYISIAEASRQTKDSEGQIRTQCQGKAKKSQAKYLWKFKNEDETEEYTKKYSSS